MTEEQTNVDRSPHWNAILAKIVAAKAAGLSLAELAETFDVEQNHAGLNNGLNHLLNAAKIHRAMGVRGGVPRVIFQPLYTHETARDRLDQEQDSDPPGAPPAEK